MHAQYMAVDQSAGRWKKLKIEGEGKNAFKSLYTIALPNKVIGKSVLPSGDIGIWQYPMLMQMVGRLGFLVNFPV